MASKRRITIQQASDELANLGYELRPQPVKQDFAAKKTWYDVADANGNVRGAQGDALLLVIKRVEELNAVLRAAGLPPR